MEKTIYFVSGLPRSGSTLLCNILAQNPRFHATETSACLDVLFGIRNQWNNLIEHKASPCPDRLETVLKAVFAAYHKDVQKPVVFNKSRGWLGYIEFAEAIIGSKIKIIVPIRPVAEILASFEVLYRETSKIRQPPGEAQNYFKFQTVQGRCDYWLQNDQVVGLSLNRLQDAIRRGFGDRLCIVGFNELTNKPSETMSKIYKFLGEENYNHNFDYVEQVTHEDDDVHGFVNLHKIRNKVEPVKAKANEILGKDLVEQIQSNYKL